MILKKIAIALIAITIGLSSCNLDGTPADTDLPDSNTQSDLENCTFEVSSDIISSEYLGDSWVNTTQVNPVSNYTLDNSEILLGNESYRAVSYSGYRLDSRGDGLPDKDSYCPTVEEIKEDMLILSAMGIKLLRTYDTQLYLHTQRLLQAISELKAGNPGFEMYVMLGAWIQCEGAYTASADHSTEDAVTNTAEINMAIEMAAAYPDIVKVIAVGNEAMVTWQAHYVPAEVILQWVQYLKTAKTEAVNGHLLPSETLITSSDNFATWGGESSYRSDTLVSLINEVDFISLHTYPFHDTHYNNAFWEIPDSYQDKSEGEKIIYQMGEAFKYSVMQYNLVKTYLDDNNIEKPVHIGETGWATEDELLYGDTGSKAADELKSKMYYKALRQWTALNNISCFYFEAFDEPWKGGPTGSETHFGLFTVDGQAKYSIWDLVDDNTFSGLSRGGNAIVKTYNGNETDLFDEIEAGLATVIEVPTLDASNPDREAGELVTENNYIVYSQSQSGDDPDTTYPSAGLVVNAWEGTCTFEVTEDAELKVSTGGGSWWGAALELSSTDGEDMSNFANGHLHFSIQGDTGATFELGFQTGKWGDSSRPQGNCYITFESTGDYILTGSWVDYTVPIQTLLSTDGAADLSDLTSALYVKGISGNDSGLIYLKNIYWTRD